MISVNTFTEFANVSVRAQKKHDQQIERSNTRIATGSKVSSIKDDNSSYLISNSVKNQSQEWSFRSEALQQIRPIFDMFANYNEEGLTTLRDAQKILAFAANTAPNSAERQRYFDEWKIVASRAADLFIQRQNLYQFTGGSSGVGYAWTQTGGVNGEWSFSPFANLNFLSGAQIAAVGFDNSITAGTNIAGYTPSVYSVNNDFMGASQALMSQAANEELNSSAGVSRVNNVVMPYTGGAQAKVDQMEKFSNKLSTIMDMAHSRMFDADISVESAKLKAAYVKSEISQNSVKLLGDHFHSLVSNILNNVSKTQRSVMA